MKDIIDLGNLVFDELILNHNELDESRILFLYVVSTNSKWHLFDNSQHWILIENTGITKNFNNKKIDELSNTWLNKHNKIEQNRNIAKIKNMQKEFDKPAPKDGDIWEFGKSSGSFKNINL